MGSRSVEEEASLVRQRMPIDMLPNVVISDFKSYIAFGATSRAFFGRCFICPTMSHSLALALSFTASFSVTFLVFEFA